LGREPRTLLRALRTDALLRKVRYSRRCGAVSFTHTMRSCLWPSDGTRGAAEAIAPAVPPAAAAAAAAAASSVPAAAPPLSVVPAAAADARPSTEPFSRRRKYGVMRRRISCAAAAPTVRSRAVASLRVEVEVGV
jgi:hypothetical protein